MAEPIGPDTLEREETLSEFLAERARRLSDSRIAGNAIAAVIVAVGVSVWRGPVWDVRIAAAACVLAFALWGAADRELRDHDLVERETASLSAPPSRLMLPRIVRWVAGVLGFSAGAYAMMSLLGRAIGRVIS